MPDKSPIVERVDTLNIGVTAIELDGEKKIILHIPGTVDLIITPLDAEFLRDKLTYHLEKISPAPAPAPKEE